MGLVTLTPVNPKDEITAASVNSQPAAIAAVVNGQIDDTNISGLSGTKIANGSVTEAKLDYPRWWQEIGRATLSSAGDTISVAGLPARKYLKVRLYVTDTGGSITVRAQFNGDTTASYASRGSLNTGAEFTSASSTSMIWDTGASLASPHYGEVNITNILAQEKGCFGTIAARGTAGAANVPSHVEISTKWANTSSSISRIDLLNVGAGDFAAGSEIVVLGHD